MRAASCAASGVFPEAVGPSMVIMRFTEIPLLVEVDHAYSVDFDGNVDG